MRNILFQLIIVSFTVVYSENMCWWTRCQKNNFTIKPDNLPCLKVDGDKTSIFKIKKKGVYVCDLCPYFPHKMFVNVSLSNIPSNIISKIMFPECFNLCSDTVNCVAFSYDNLKHTCYIFNNTIGTLVTRDDHTTVLIKQPVGVLEKWRYSRHTSLTGVVLKSSAENSFLICLSKCNENDACNYVSYSIKTSNCSMFSSQEQIKYTYLNYGHISAFRITSLTAGSDAISRFITEGEDLYITENVKKYNNNNNKECLSFKNSSHSAFYSKECLTSGSNGCNSTTGCKLCYYPGKTIVSSNLDMCPDSDWTVLNNLQKSVQKEAGNCLENTSCIGIGFSSNTKELHQLTFNNFASNEYTTKFLLIYPTIQSVDQDLMTKYDFMFNYDIIQISNNANSFQETVGTTLRDCLNHYQSNNNYIRMSYSANKCKISSEEVKYVFTSGNFVIAFKKPALTSPLLNYGRTPGIVLPKENAKNTFDECGKNCEVACAKKCNNEFKGWCSHFSIQQDENKAKCFFFEILRDSVADSINLQQMGHGQIFTKISSLDFTLESLNKLNLYQSIDVHNCFLPGSENQQTQKSSTRLQASRSQDIGVISRRKRRLAFFLGITWLIASMIISLATRSMSVLDVVSRPSLPTFPYPNNQIPYITVRSNLNIPIIKNVTQVLDQGKGVVAGDWNILKERGVEKLESVVLSAETSVIPVTALHRMHTKLGFNSNTRVTKVLGKNQLLLMKISPMKDISEVNDNNNVGNNNKFYSYNMKNNINNEIDGERNECKKRMKRTAGYSIN